MDTEAINRLIENMSIDELLGQLLCYSYSEKWTDEEFSDIVKRTKPGGIFIKGAAPDTIKKIVDIANKEMRIPIIVSADVENGPGCAISGEAMLPFPMAWGACDDEELIEKAGEATAAIARKCGIHWTFAPDVDLSINPNNPENNIRAVSDSPKQVVKIAGAYLRGLQKNNVMMACCKHFPGNGADDRNSHFCTVVNPLSKEEWMKTYGYVYKELIAEGVSSIMPAHTAFPAYDDEKIDEIIGYKSATFSKKILTGLLKQELGFDGCIVSDALSMIGACAMFPEAKLVPEFIKAGGDMALFTQPSDFDRLKEAYEAGELSIERIKDAVFRILTLKERARIFDDNKLREEDIEIKYDINAIADEIGDKSIKFVRNAKGILPVKLEKGDKVLVVNIQKLENERTKLPMIRYLDEFENQLRERGLEVEVLTNPGHIEVKEKMQGAKTVFVNCKVGVHDYLGGSLRVAWANIMTFWRGFLLEHPCVVFTSFGDPYKLYEFPYLYTYVNAFSSSEASQRGAVRVLLGEKPMVAKNPVNFKGFFEREVD
ncbi:MAG: glycoside hydrolase family 3 protein [Clostridia bacterium]|nr:glycoside hydrolase family 3 protein [Clostridia bacterium]